MSEVPQPNPAEMQDMRIHDKNEAHEMAMRVDSLETEKARILGGMALIGEVYERPEETTLRDVSLEDVKRSLKGEESNRFVLDNATKATELTQDMLVTRGFDKEIVEKITDKDIVVDHPDTYNDIAAEATNRTDELNRTLDDVYNNNGLTPDEQAKQSEVQKIRDSIVADLKKSA
jgi:hypothetical protein